MAEAAGVELHVHKGTVHLGDWNDFVVIRLADQVKRRHPMQGVTIAQQHDARAALLSVVADRHRLAVVITATPLIQDVVGITCGSTEGRLDVGRHGASELMHRGAANRDRCPWSRGGAHQLRTCAWCWCHDADTRIITGARLSRGNVGRNTHASKREHEACQHHTTATKDGARH